MNYTDTVSTNPPRLVVVFSRGDAGQENFKWGVVGAVPILTALGYIGKVQADLVARAWIPACDNPQPALVIVWDSADAAMSHYVSPDIPPDSLAGMLEVIKSELVLSRMGQRSGILGPDGKPLRA